MILEVAILKVKPNRSAQFEKDFQKAGQYISSIQGYVNHSLQKCIEQENQYLLFA